MVPFSFPQPLLKSRVMKRYLTGALDDVINGLLDNWVQRHAGAGAKRAVLPTSHLVGRRCCAAPIKNFPRCCHGKTAMNQIPFWDPTLNSEPLNPKPPHAFVPIRVLKTSF